MSDPAHDSLRFAPPSARIADPVETGLVLADRGARFGAAMIDVVVAVAYLGLIALVSPWNPFMPDPSRPFTATLLAQLASFAGFVVIHGYLLVRRGQTIGKRLVGVRIVMRDGAQASAGRVIGLRYGLGFALASVPLVGIAYSLIDALLIFGSQRRCVHDLIAGTIVVRA